MEMYNLPVGLRHWWLDRLRKHYEEEKKEIDKAERKGRR
tara:strand:- start:267 stop:383 length:117 start_codon:yes stop_codon:yes gene_type:complete